MQTLENIMTRRSLGRMNRTAPSKEDIQALLDAAVTAPNHHITQPWRFFVLSGNALNRLGEAMAESLRQRLAREGREPGESDLERERKKPLRSPVIVAVACVYSSDDPIQVLEDRAAVAAATQNILLAAHERGIASIWRTGEAAYDPVVKAFFGLRPSDDIVALVYLGYSDMEPEPRKRTPASEFTTWMSE